MNKPKGIVKEHACGQTYTEVPEDAKYWEFGTCPDGEPLFYWLWQCTCKSHIAFPGNKSTIETVKEKAEAKERA